MQIYLENSNGLVFFQKKNPFKPISSSQVVFSKAFPNRTYFSSVVFLLLPLL